MNKKKELLLGSIAVMILSLTGCQSSTTMNVTTNN